MRPRNLVQHAGGLPMRFSERTAFWLFTPACAVDGIALSVEMTERLPTGGGELGLEARPFFHTR